MGKNCNKKTISFSRNNTIFSYSQNSEINSDCKVIKPSKEDEAKIPNQLNIEGKEKKSAPVFHKLNSLPHMKPPLSKNSTKGSTSHMKFSQKNSLSSSSTFKNSTGSLARFGNLQRQSWNKQRDPSLTQNTHQNVDFLKSKSSTPLRSNYYSKMDMFRQKNKIGSDSPLIEIFKKPNYFTDKYDMIRSPQPHY
ncbi:unnamed protein product [Moneuplotes crassus]|uniref:Uncharacterized protein n=1 Tax=Euplotes crassus TaxID=5936 RepID=A0AAD1XX44_EUPCR|nr:unnamed protein product [Moneuplotes crassus]